MPIDPDRVILGTFGSVFINGEEMANFNHLEAVSTMDKIELKLAGSRYTKHKKGPIKGTGTMSGFKTTSKMLGLGWQRFEIISKLADPEAYGYERVRIKNCMVDRQQWANWTAGEAVAEEIPFTFDDEPELLDPIVAS